MRQILKEISNLLADNRLPCFKLDDILNSDDQSVWNFLTSNELWGGSGSLADQALIEFPDARKQFEELMIKLGEIQLSAGKVNVRTTMWISAFREWRQDPERILSFDEHSPK